MNNINEKSFVSGIIITGDNHIFVRTRPEYLILDCRSYALEMLASQEDAIARLQSSNDENHKRTISLFQRTVQELKQWLKTREGDVPSIRSFSRRLRLQNHQVRGESLRPYIALVLSLSRAADTTDIPQFVFHVDKPQSIIIACQELRLVAAHSGPEILGVKETIEEVNQRAELATASWSLRN